MRAPAKQRFLDLLAAAFAEGSFVRLTLGHPPAAEGVPRKLLLRPVVVRGEKVCGVVSRFATRDETKNHSFSEALKMVEAKLGAQFMSAHLLTETADVHLELGKKEALRVAAAARKPAPLEHDRERARWVDTGAQWLRALGVTDNRGKVRERMGGKFRQIERFVDLLASAFREGDPGARKGKEITMCDMGCGKGYLTFAAYDYFRRVEKLTANVTGVEAREDLVVLCNKAARECGFEGLWFVRSAIGDYLLPPLDILVALHACDTATDDALFAGVRAGAEIILAAPCCHKEARPQVDHAAPDGPLGDILRHGIYAERHAEMATDALRVLLLERAGYRVRVAEFVSPEHTAKNIMLLATKRAQPPAAAALAGLDRRIAGVKQFYGITRQRFERLLAGESVL